MFAVAARRLGYRLAVWDPDIDAPALKLADLSLSAPFTDAACLSTFASSIGAATYEWENIPVQVSDALEARVPVRPASRILKVLQNRLEQKTFLAGRGIPVAPFAPIVSPSDLETAAQAIGFPSLCKTTTHGYDGKGQWRLSDREELHWLQEQLNRQGQSPWVLEQFLSFTKELSVLVVRATDGDRRTYPAVENVHEAGILRTTRVPAEIDPRTTERAAALAGSVVAALDGVGVFCVELFLMPDGRLLINEVAPRPHNSGHYTLDACPVSQFEQQVRAVCGLPLGEVRLLCPAVMVNLVGEDFTKVSSGEGLAHLLRTPGAKLHVYGKKSVRPGRKMGHVTFLGKQAEQAWESAQTLRRMLGNL
jgi:5-(carboxyamino)imidazole ribonucleotide synthase